MTPAFTVILPHLNNPGNNDALSICLDCLTRNTVNEFALILDTDTSQSLYATVNRMVKQTYTDCCVYLASDTFVAPGWDAPMLEAWNRTTIVTGVLVEPGAIGIHANNVYKEFGRKPETFRRADFEKWAELVAPFADNEGWPCPYMVSKEQFLLMGGFRTDLQGDMHGFTPADMVFWNDWKASGRKIQRVRSYAYHLQRYSQEDEQMHEKRGA